MIKYGYEGLEIVRSKIGSTELKEKGKNSVNDFTRKRKMDFEKLIHYILNRRGLSTIMEINNFFNKIGENIDMSAQSLLEQRLKLNPEVFIELNREYLEVFYKKYKDTDVKTYKGYILKAIDGSDFEIPNTKKSRDEFGRVQGTAGESIPRASVSMCYDVLNEYVIDVIPEKYRTGEIEMAKKHIKKDEEITNDYESIYIMDRNYVSLDFINFFEKNGKNFLCRMKNSYYKKEISEMKSNDEIIEIKHTKDRLNKKHTKGRKPNKKNKFTKVRIIKYILSTGEEEYLITNVKDFNYDEIIEIYAKRWNIETAYFSLKSKLQIERFTSSNGIIIRQDIYASVLVYNMIQTMKNEAKEEIQQNNYKHEMKINENVAIGLFKNEMIYILLETNENKRLERYDKLSKKMLKYKIPIRKDRNYKIAPRILNQNSYNKLKGY